MIAVYKYLHRKKVWDTERLFILAKKCKPESSDWKLKLERVKADIRYKF